MIAALREAVKQSDAENKSSINAQTRLPAIKEFLGKRTNRFLKSGYTGNPHAPENRLAAQLAWLCVDWTKPNTQEQFWKILYPEIKSVYDGGDNEIWPAYGLGILVKNKAGDLQERLINYTEIYKLAQTKAGFEKIKNEFALETFHRIYRFYPGHNEFLAQVQNEHMPALNYQDYEAFFTDLQKFILE